MTDKALLKIVTSFTKGILGNMKPSMMCFAVCSPLCTYLNGVGVEAELVRGVIYDRRANEHYWLKLKDGRIIDPTASQFLSPYGAKMPHIYFGEKPDWYKTPKIFDKKSKNKSV